MNKGKKEEGGIDRIRLCKQGYMYSGRCHTTALPTTPNNLARMTTKVFDPHTSSATYGHKRKSGRYSLAQILTFRPNLGLKNALRKIGQTENARN